jgi:hypothetical protein
MFFYSESEEIKSGPRWQIWGMLPLMILSMLRESSLYGSEIMKLVVTRAGLEPWYSLPRYGLFVSRSNGAQNHGESRTSKLFHDNAEGLQLRIGSPFVTLFGMF